MIRSPQRQSNLYSMRKKYLFIAICIFIVQFSPTLIAQEVFSKLIPYIDDQSVADIEEDNGYIYVLEWIYETPDLTKGINRISVLSADGEILSQRYPKTDNNRLFYKFLKFNNELYLMGNEKNLTGENCLAIYHINENAVFSRMMLIPLSQYHIIDMTKPQIIDDGEHFVLSTLHFRAALHYQMVFLKINKRFGLIQQKVYDPDHSCKAYNFIPSGTGFTLSAILFPLYNYSIQLSRLDSNFIITKTYDTYNLGMSAPSDILGLYNGNFMFMTKSTIENDVYISSMNDDLITRSSVHVGKSGDTADRPASTSGLILAHDRRLLSGSTANHDGNIFSNENSWFHLIKYSAFPNIEWEHFYGGDAFYTLSHILAAENGDFILAGTKYDALTQNFTRDNIVMRVSPEGLITTIPDRKADNDPNINIYPNPGLDQIQIDMDNSTKIRSIFFTNTAGQTILSMDYPGNNLNTASLESGNYIITILLGNGKLINKNWIKQ